IFSKIREVDAVLQSDRSLHGRVRETHPELAFWRLNGARPLPSPKKTEAGLALRRRLLIEAGLPAAVVNDGPPKGADRDDLLDALACTAIARRIHQGLAQRSPIRPSATPAVCRWRFGRKRCCVNQAAMSGRGITPPCAWPR